MISWSENMTVRVWEVDSGQVINASLHGHTGPVICVALNGNFKRVISGLYDKTERVWDVDC